MTLAPWFKDFLIKKFIGQEIFKKCNKETKYILLKYALEDFKKEMIKIYGSLYKYQLKWIKSQGYKNAYEYLNHLAQINGFKNEYEYRNHLAVRRGFKSHRDLERHRLKAKGFDKPFHWWVSQIQKNGFKNIKEWQEALALKNGFSSHKDRRINQRKSLLIKKDIDKRCTECSNKRRIGGRLCQKCYDRKMKENINKRTVAMKNGKCLRCGKLKDIKERSYCLICRKKYINYARKYRKDKKTHKA